MQILFDSMTGNVRRFSYRLADTCGVPALDLRAHAPAGPFLLVTYTFGRGEMPESTARFLERYAGGLRGVVASGSFHWGAHFARAGEQIAGRYGVPLVAKLNKSGSEADAQAVAGWLLGNLREHTFGEDAYEENAGGENARG